MESAEKALDPRLRRMLHNFRENPRELSRDIERGAVASSAEVVAGEEPIAEALTKRVLVKLTTDMIPDSLADLQWSRIVDDIYTVEVALMRLAELARTPGVQYVSGGHVMAVDLDTSVAECRASLVHAGMPSLRGQGVVVGIIDLGCDFALDDFRDSATGQTRVAFLWDQSLSPIGAERSPAGFPHGVEYTAADIDAALNGAGAVRHAAAVRSHGTHVMGIATGSGRSFDNAFAAGRFVGCAPEATIVFVQPSTGAGVATFTDSVHVAEAIAYVFQKAEELGLPCVINMSLGQNGGSHDGESVVERAIDRLLEEPGHALVVAGGNEHVWRTHAEGQLASGQRRTLRWRVGGPAPVAGAQPRPDRTPNEMEIWYSSRDLFDVQITDPAGNTTAVVQPGQSIAHSFPGGNEAFVDSERFTVMNGDARIYIEISPGTTTAVRSGLWEVEITARQRRDGSFDAWIERDFRDPNQHFADQSFFEGNDFAPVKTLGTPATARRVIAVANYRHAPPVVVSDSSGRGPTRDGRRKPEVAGPGTDIRSSNARGGRPVAGSSGPVNPMRVSMSGTSMAAPHVAGIVALMLERNPGLTSAQIGKILAATARPPSGGGFDVGFGFGLVDGEAAVAAVP